MSRRFQFRLKTLFGLQTPTRRGYLGGFLYAIFGDSGDDGIRWEVLAGVLVGCTLGCLADRFVIAPYPFAVVGSLIGPIFGAAVVALRIANQPRPTPQSSDRVRRIEPAKITPVRRRFQFSLGALLVIVLFVACAAAGFVAGSPLWWAIWLAALGLLAGLSAYRAMGSRPAVRAACFITATIAAAGVVHATVAGHPWTGSWLIGLAWTEATSGNGWFTWYGASAIGIYYAICWATASLIGGTVAWLIFATQRKSEKRR